MFAFLAGWRLYVLAIVVFAFLGLSGAVFYQRQVHKADVAELAAAKQTIDQFSNALKQEEADKAELSRRIAALDDAVKAEHELQAKLEKDKEAISEKLDALKKTLPAADQSCMDRQLPDAILGLLRDGPANRDTQRDPESTGKPADALH